MRRFLRSLFLLSFLVLIAQAKEKKPIEWLTGVLLDVSSERAHARGIADVTYYTIDDGQQYVYVLARKLTERWDTELLVTVHAPVKFAVVGEKEFLLLDDKGKAHKLYLQKRSLRISEAAK